MPETIEIAPTNGTSNTSAVPSTNGSTVPATAAQFDNPFDAIAYLFMVMRESIEGTRDENDYPRYVRIVRPKSDTGAQDTWVEYISETTRIGVQGLTFIMAKFVDLTLYGRSMLVGIDSLVALLEVALQTIGTATNREFLDALKKSFTPPSDGAQVIPISTDGADGGMSSDWATKAQEYLKYIPSPQDLDRIGYELYMLARVMYKDGPGADEKLKQFNLIDSGKLRVMAWAYQLNWNVHYPKNGDDFVKGLYAMGKKSGATRPSETVEVNYKDSDIRLFESSVAKEAPVLAEPEKDFLNADVHELKSLLEELGYTAGLASLLDIAQGGTPLSNDGFLRAIKWFQRENDLPQTTVLDNETLNRLFNLDHSGKNIKRAKRASGEAPNPEIAGGKLKLINGTADDYEIANEVLVENSDPNYNYYMVSKTFSSFPTDTVPGQVVTHDNSPWKIATDEQYPNDKVKIVPGFVGIQSRRVINLANPAKTRYDGGIFSEGASSDGKFFFAARENEPWRPGRSGTPRGNRLWDSSTPQNGLSRMYQDVDIEPEIFERFASISTTDIDPAKTFLKVQASTMFRSLFTDKASSGTNLLGFLKKGKSDQGRVLLELRSGTVGATGDYTGNDALSAGDDPNDFVLKWGPSAAVTKLMGIQDGKTINERHIDQYNTWKKITSSEIKFSLEKILALKAQPTGIPRFAVRVFLDGMHISGWDIDAYFDNVEIRWDYILVKA
ncbi:peptidoglycan-binding domain-containing protein [Reichenbachiella sp.]|uniref:peptidoglycan-binding domain-containing protein n=1 Tax=Reichenbachiella sp. TaxID=2184521 RepID=UPI003BAEDD24